MTATRQAPSVVDVWLLARQHSRTCRVLLTGADTVSASHVARAEYVALFRANFRLTPPDEWLSRWWPHG